MKCPIDNADLQMTERQNVEIDYCPKCRGIWLDRGELDKIIERLEKESTPSTSQSSVPPSPNQQSYPSQSYGGHYDKHGGYGKRRKGLLGELFDF